MSIRKGEIILAGNVYGLHPVGSIYLSIENVSPASFFGGTWEKLPDGYALWTATSGAGNTISAGLPNIKGSFKVVSAGVVSFQLDSGSGAFYGTNNVTPNRVSQISQATNSLPNVFNFNAHNSNNIYDDSVTTVQPPAYKVFAWKRIS